LRTGGLSGVEKLIQSKNIGTIELSTGIQISGVFTNVIGHEGKAIYIQTLGESALASRDKELIGHGTNYHSAGFGSPIGKLEGINLAIEDMSPRDLEIYGIYEGKRTTLLFEGGVQVEGQIITGKRDLKGKIMLISFQDCTVSHNNEILFKPEWGVYDMAIGKEIISAYAGPADIESFQDLYKVSTVKTHKIKYSDSELSLHKHYQEVRDMRKNKKVNIDLLAKIMTDIQENYSKEWLLPLEIYELIYNSNHPFEQVVYDYLNQLKSDNNYIKLIVDGMQLVTKQEVLF
jgi:phenylalanine-4-hydroxylase